MSETLKERLQEQIKAAMKGGDKVRLQYARTLHAEIKRKEVDTRTELDDSGVIEIVTRLVKQRNESIEQAEKAGREEMAANERAEKAFLEEYLPPALSDDELRDLVREAIAETGASTPKDMGKVMKALTPKTAGRADNKVVSTLVREELAKG